MRGSLSLVTSAATNVLIWVEWWYSTDAPRSWVYSLLISLIILMVIIIVTMQATFLELGQ